MEKTLKIIVKLNYDRFIVLDPTQENMKLAMQLANLPIYDDRWTSEHGSIYVLKDGETIDIRMERVNVGPLPEAVDAAAA